MKVPQVVSLLLLFAVLGFVAVKPGEREAGPAPDAVAEEAERAPAPAPTLETAVSGKRPVFSGPHDGSHIYQGVVCPACERGPREF